MLSCAWAARKARCADTAGGMSRSDSLLQLHAGFHYFLGIELPTRLWILSCDTKSQEQKVRAYRVAQYPLTLESQISCWMAAHHMMVYTLCLHNSRRFRFRLLPID